jgi:hypothetical protein
VRIFARPLGIGTRRPAVVAVLARIAALIESWCAVGPRSHLPLGRLHPRDDLGPQFSSVNITTDRTTNERTPLDTGGGLIGPVAWGIFWRVGSDPIADI